MGGTRAPSEHHPHMVTAEGVEIDCPWWSPEWLHEHPEYPLSANLTNLTFLTKDEL